jgi:type II restriction/modification system DNA methylase subunit YeeA
VDVLRHAYEGSVPGGADLVTYWFEKSRAHIEAEKLQAAGLVSTNSIRGGANRVVLDSIVQNLRIFEAWNDEPWVNDGAAVRVSLVGFGKREGVRLNGKNVEIIHADLTTGQGLDLTKAKQLPENMNTSFIGTQKSGPFDVPGELAREWLKLPNPNRKPNSEVVKPWSNGMDITRRPSDTWIIDFGNDKLEAEAALYEKPFEYVMEHVKSVRMKVNRESHRRHWWRHGEARVSMRVALEDLQRFIATCAHAKHRFFVWMPANVCPDHANTVIARDDDITFGILHSRFHELWSLRLGSSLEDRPRYTPTTCFETFPFPEGLSPKEKSENSAIANAAHHLNQLRENWLNPPEWTDWQLTPEEAKANFPKRPVAKPGHESDLKKRTLTKPIQPTSRLARHGPQNPRQSRSCCLRLDRLRTWHARRRNSDAVVSIEPREGEAVGIAFHRY